MGYGKVGVSKERMCSYKHTHNSAVHISPNGASQTYGLKVVDTPSEFHDRVLETNPTKLKEIIP